MSFIQGRAFGSCGVESHCISPPQMALCPTFCAGQSPLPYKLWATPGPGVPQRVTVRTSLHGSPALSGCKVKQNLVFAEQVPHIPLLQNHNLSEIWDKARER